MLSDLIYILESVMQLTMIVMIGLYFTFSNTVMKALKNNSSGAEVMVEINQVILNPVFMFFFIGSAASALYLTFFSEGLDSASAIIFFIGTTVVTAIKNVPLNNQLRDASEEQRPEIWSQYLKEWVFWNHVRTISAMSAGLLIVL